MKTLKVPIKRAKEICEEFNADSLILVYFKDTPDDTMYGYTSYGKTKAFCLEAQKRADKFIATLLEGEDDTEK